MIFWLAGRNLNRQKRRYVLLVLAAIFGFAIVTIAQALVAGLAKNLNDGGSRYYGGHILVHGRSNTNNLDLVKDEALIRTAIAQSGIDQIRAIVRRTHVYDTGFLFFNGERRPLRRIIGLDWSAASPVLNDLSYLAGGPQNVFSKTGILVSSQTAKNLDLRLGDDVILQAPMVAGPINTINLVVAGIFRDASIFSAYTVYMDRSALNELIRLPEEDYNNLGIYLEETRDIRANTLKISQALSLSGLKTFDYGKDRNHYMNQLSQVWDGWRYAVLSVEDHLYQLRSLFEAIELVTWFFLALMFGIITIGVLNTYRIIVRERVKEIGTMRALGMKRQRISNLFLIEAFLLSSIGIVGGTLLGFLGLLLVQNIDLSHLSGFDIFLYRGKLSWNIYFETWLFDALLVSSSIVLGAWLPSRYARNIIPCEALRAE